MKKPSEQSAATFEDLIGLGRQSARKSYYPELERKVAELEQERNRYKWLFENALHGIFRAELEGGILAANPAIAAILGYDSPAACVEQVPSFQELFVDIGDLAYVRIELRQRRQLTAFETRLRRRGGGAVDVAMSMLLKHEAGREVVEAFVADVTERKRARERLQQLNAELELRVAQRTEELLELNAQLREAKEVAEGANRSKDKYLAAASHDLLQPMNAARLLVSTLRERQLPGQDGYLVDRVHLALEGAEELLTDLLDISKLDQNAVRPDPSVFPLQALFEPLAAEMQPVAASEGLRFRVFCPKHLEVRSDSRLLTRILRNLLSNALRYTREGGVLLGVRRRGDRLSLEVWDSGDGIDPDKLGEIFQEFRQLPDHHPGERRGVGLGLAIVDRIARVLEHPVAVASTPGRGSVFAVEVPLAGRNARHETQMSPAVLTGGELEGRRVLVVDNDESVLISMQALLQQWGCEARVARDLAGAERQVAEYPTPPDVVLADYHLDWDCSGLDVVDALRRHYGEGLAAAMITADRSAETLRRFRELGLPVLAKPVRPGKLRALLTHLLAGS